MTMWGLLEPYLTSQHNHPSAFVIAITLFSVVIAVLDTAIHETKVSRGNLLPMDHPIKPGDDGVGTIGTLF